MSEKSLELHTSPRIYKEEEFIASEGRIKLLERVAEHGSIQTASSAMEMSYRHAWGMIRKMEDALGKKLVESSRGGRHGGKTVLTEEAEKLIAFFRSREKALENISRYGPPPALTVDVIVVKDGCVLLVERGNPPFRGMLALPGGFVEYGETVEEAAAREVQEETGLVVKIEGLEGVFSDPCRDPRGHSVSVVFTARVSGGKLHYGDDAASAKFVPLKKAKGLA